MEAGDSGKAMDRDVVVVPAREAHPMPGELPRERFWNLPNSVTMLRIGVVPVLLFLPMSMTVSGSRYMAWAFIVAARRT